MVGVSVAALGRSYSEAVESVRCRSVYFAREITNEINEFNVYAYCTLERSAKLAQKVHGCNNLELVPTTIWVARERSKIEDQCDVMVKQETAGSHQQKLLSSHTFKPLSALRTLSL